MFETSEPWESKHLGDLYKTLNAFIPNQIRIELDEDGEISCEYLHVTKGINLRIIDGGKE